MTHCSLQHLVDRHFAARIRPAEELSLRQHLPTCENCHRHYERHQLLSELDPSAPCAKDRLAHGLGLSGSGTAITFLRPRVPLLVAAAAAACLVVFFLGRRLPPSEFQARGTVAESRVWVYRVGVDGKPVELAEIMAPSDELAFAFDNPRGAQRLLIFGVDEHRHVYWYHPAWIDPATTPTAVSIATGRHELPEAVSHKLDGGVLTLYAVFTNEGVTVKDVEKAITLGDGKFTTGATWSRRVRVAQ